MLSNPIQRLTATGTAAAAAAAAKKASTTNAATPTSTLFHQVFSAGLGRNGRIASWMVAFVGAGIWIYLEKKDTEQITPFSIMDTKLWNTAQQQQDQQQQQQRKNNQCTNTTHDSGTKVPPPPNDCDCHQPQQ